MWEPKSWTQRWLVRFRRGWKEGGRGGGRRVCTCRQSPSIDSPLIHVFKPLAGRDGQMEPVQSKYMSY